MREATSTFRKNPSAPSLHFSHRAVCGITIPRADAGRMMLIPLLHSQAECTKFREFREGRKHNKFRLQVRVPEGNKVEDEQWRLDGRRVCVCACAGKRGVTSKEKKNLLACTIPSHKFPKSSQKYLF